MPRGRPRKIVKTSPDYVAQQDIVQSSDSEPASSPKNSHQSLTKKPQPSTNIKTQKPNHSTNSNMSKKSSKEISIEEIKRQILLQTPEMKDQIEILDDQTLRQIFENEMAANINLKNSHEDTKSQHQLEEATDKIERTAQILQMIDQILQHAPNMQSQIEKLENDYIRQLYQEICPPKNVNHTRENYNNRGNQNNETSAKSMAQIRQFMIERVPDMENQMKALQDEDLMEVYRDYIEREQVQKKRKLPNASSPIGQNKKPAKIIPHQTHKMPFDSFDPMRKFVKEETPMKATMPDVYPSYGEFNGYKYPKGNLSKPPQIVQPPRYVSNFSHEVASFHNHKRVTALPLDAERLPKTVIIVHTMQPGYLPPPKPKCRCQCCTRRQFDQKDPTYMSEFIHNLLQKNVFRR